MCKVEKPHEHYYKRREYKTSSYCKICNKADRVKRNKENKIKAVEYFGGKCIDCGYNKYVGALDFHHTDDSLKSDNYHNLKNMNFKNFLQALIDQKCELVCANCHRERHASIYPVATNDLKG